MIYPIVFPTVNRGLNLYKTRKAFDLTILTKALSI